MRFRTLTVWALGLAATLPVTSSAADATPASAASQNDDSIASAKRELDQLKRAATAGAIDSRPGALPSVAIPQVHTDEEPALILPPEDPTKPKRKQPSANWLVEAMMSPKRDGDKSTDRTRGDRRTTRDLDILSGNKSDTHLATDADKSLDPEKLAAAPKSAEAPPPPRPDTVFNPLAQFMTSWMTPQDYSLLRPGVDKPATVRSADALPGPAGPNSDSGALSALAGIGGDTFAAPKASYAPIVPAENPFLSGLTLPDAPPPTSMPPPSSAAPIQPPPPLVTPLPAQEPEHSTIPDFAKPSDDDKYLKPLKRF